MADNKITLDRGEWVHSLMPDDLPETFRFSTVDITDRAKFLEYFAYDLKNAGGTKRVTFGHGMLRDLYELAVVALLHQSEGRLTASPLMAAPVRLAPTANDQSASASDLLSPQSRTPPET